MMKNQAEQLVSELDSIECDMRGLEGRMTQVRRALQREYRIVYWDDPQAEHGVTCPKAPHGAGGYLHLPEDDGPYDVDGVTYCGRCHVFLPAEVAAGHRDAPCRPSPLSERTE